MIEIYPSLEINGETFSPSKAAAICGLVFSNMVEPGETMMRGRYRGSPAPYGAGSLRLADDLVPLLEIFRESRAEILACGATSITLNLGIEYEGQCNLEFSAAELHAIAGAQIPMTISCWAKVDDPS
jgi:hypothetical protein